MEIDSNSAKFEDSLRILISIFVTLQQNLEALMYFEENIADDAELFKKTKIFPPKSMCFDEAVSESLWFQIIMKACAFIEEWDDVLGVKTEKVYAERIEKIKKIVAPARRKINKWKDLKKFRNEIIAHNLRAKDSSYAIADMPKYKIPGCTEELALLTTILQRMIGILSHFSNEELMEVHESIPKLLMNRENTDIIQEVYIFDVNEMDKKIQENLESINL